MSQWFRFCTDCQEMHDKNGDHPCEVRRRAAIAEESRLRVKVIHWDALYEKDRYMSRKHGKDFHQGIGQRISSFADLQRKAAAKGMTIERESYGKGRRIRVG